MTFRRPEIYATFAELSRTDSLAVVPHDGAAGNPLVLLRHTLMNPYLLDHDSRIRYIQRYFD